MAFFKEKITAGLAGIFAAVFILSAIALLLAFPSRDFTAETILMLKPSQGQAPESVVTLSKKAESLEVLNAAAAELQTAPSELREKLRIFPDESKGEIRISAVELDSARAVRMVNAAARAFLKADVADEALEARNRQEFFVRQIKVAFEKLETLQKQIEDVRAKLLMPDLAAETREAFEKEQKDITELLRESDRQYRQLNMDYESARLEEAAKSGRISILKLASLPTGRVPVSLPFWKILVISCIVSLIVVSVCRYFISRYLI